MMIQISNKFRKGSGKSVRENFNENELFGYKV